MKQFIAVFSLFLGFISCTNQADSSNPPDHTLNQVLIKFKTEPFLVQTRGFFEDTPQAEEWENEVNSLTVLVYPKSASGTDLPIAVANFSTLELKDGEMYIGVPMNYIGQQLEFYAIANCANRNLSFKAMTYREITGMLSGGISLYNRIPFADLISGETPPEGFEMAQMIEVRKTDDGSITVVPIELERMVNKVAIQTRIADTFSDFYNGGTLTITNVTFDCVDQCYWYKTKSLLTSVLTSYPQEPTVENGIYQNLFFCYESKTPQKITLEALYDEDGDPATTDDQKIVSYTFTTDAGNTLRNSGRNEYFRIHVTIYGLPENIQSAFVVDEAWKNVTDENPKLGL